MANQYGKNWAMDNIRVKKALFLHLKQSPFLNMKFIAELIQSAYSCAYQRLPFNLAPILRGGLDAMQIH